MHIIKNSLFLFIMVMTGLILKRDSVMDLIISVLKII